MSRDTKSGDTSGPETRAVTLTGLFYKRLLNRVDPLYPFGVPDNPPPPRNTKHAKKRIHTITYCSSPVEFRPRVPFVCKI